jgi:hypothetical protein
MTITDKVNITLIAATASAVIWMFSHFASAAEVNQLKLEILYGQYYDRFDDYEEALSEGREGLAKEYLRQMERIKAQICEEDPEWERCD